MEIDQDGKFTTLLLLAWQKTHLLIQVSGLIFYCPLKEHCREIGPTNG